MHFADIRIMNVVIESLGENEGIQPFGEPPTTSIPEKKNNLLTPLIVPSLHQQKKIWEVKFDLCYILENVMHFLFAFLLMDIYFRMGLCAF